MPVEVLPVHVQLICASAERWLLLCLNATSDRQQSLQGSQMLADYCSRFQALVNRVIDLVARADLLESIFGS